MTKTEHAKEKSQESGWETVKVILQALLIAFVIRTFLFQPFNIPSGSMIPTLRIGDYLFVNKLSYGYGPMSFNMKVGLFGADVIKFGPMPFTGRVFAGEPERGDVLVFKLPRDNETDYIKRVIGLPGDRIQMINGVLYINSQAVKRERIKDFVPPDGYDQGRRIPQYRETLPNGVSYNTLDLSPNSSADNTDVYVVPAGHYFMMGDNRDNSTDSRFINDVGFVPYENLIGKATIIFFSHDKDGSILKFWTWPTSIRWSRLLNFVQ